MKKLTTTFSINTMLAVAASAILSLATTVAMASGVTSAPSEASIETSSKQSSEGSSNSSSGDSDRNDFVANNIAQITVDVARHGGATVTAMAYMHDIPEQQLLADLQTIQRDAIGGLSTTAIHAYLSHNPSHGE